MGNQQRAEYNIIGILAQRVRGVPKEGREKIDKLRMELDELIKETKEKY